MPPKWPQAEGPGEMARQIRHLNCPFSLTQERRLLVVLVHGHHTLGKKQVPGTKQLER